MGNMKRWLIGTGWLVVLFFGTAIAAAVCDINEWDFDREYFKNVWMFGSGMLCYAYFVRNNR